MAFCYHVPFPLKFHFKKCRSQILLLPLGFFWFLRVFSVCFCLEICWPDSLVLNQWLGQGSYCHWNLALVTHVPGNMWGMLLGNWNCKKVVKSTCMLLCLVRTSTVASCTWLLIIFFPHYSTNKGLSSELIRIVVLLYFSTVFINQLAVIIKLNVSSHCRFRPKFTSTAANNWVIFQCDVLMGRSAAWWAGSGALLTWECEWNGL